MTIRVHIERLVLDPRALEPRQVPQFRIALVEALGRLQAPVSKDAPPPARDRVGRLAERTAQAINRQMVRR